MPLSVDYIYKYSLALIRKNQSGSVTATEFQYHWNSEQNAYFSDLLGRFQKANNGKEGANTGLIQNQTIITKLTPFIKTLPLTITAGQVVKPADFAYELALRVDDNSVYHINHNQISSVKNSVLDAPNDADGKYYCVEYSNYYSFLPDTISSAMLDYIAYPINVVWAFAFDNQGRQQYSPSTSIQPQWDQSSAMEITKRMLKSLGVSLAAKDFENFGESNIETGN